MEKFITKMIKYPKPENKILRVSELKEVEDLFYRFDHILNLVRHENVNVHLRNRSLIECDEILTKMSKLLKSILENEY